MKMKSLSRVRPSATPWTAAYQAPPPWDFPGKSTGVGCHCLLQETETQSTRHLKAATRERVKELRQSKNSATVPSPGWAQGHSESFFCFEKQRQKQKDNFIWQNLTLLHHKSSQKSWVRREFLQLDKGKVYITIANIIINVKMLFTVYLWNNNF